MATRQPSNSDAGLTFWDHLDVMRDMLVRVVACVCVAAVAAFCMKDLLFEVVLAPRTSNFVIYKLLGVEPFEVNLINTGLTEQFMTHMRVSLYAGLLIASPYALAKIFGFISPGLYANERRAGVKVAGAAYLMFLLGTSVGYFLVFPFTLRFLATYQVSTVVDNMLTLQSYIDTMLMLCFVMGVVFQLPVICSILGRMHLINSGMMSRFRRHAVVVILVAAAIITPTTDIFTLTLVALPIYMLYEMSIIVVKLTNK